MRKGFTLLELLIASSIFAIVMLITTATFTWASSYNNKLGEMRKTSLTARKIMEMLSQDIRMANGDIKLIRGGAPGSPWISGEVVVLRCSAPSISSCVPNTSFQNNADVVFNQNNNALLIAQKDREKVVLYRLNNGSFSRSEVKYLSSYDLAHTGLPLRGGVPWSDAGATSNINSTGTDVEVQFAGYTPKVESATRKQQPFVKIRLVAQSENYDDLAPAFRSRIELQTSVTTRFYNIDK
ncbi:MAG: hypothetical protein BWY19_01111 [bacterium ADurb.Bin212]|nr:MAG: hypothetical protein BWY19_01111 [bacterium ADurb.Bin212]